MERCARDLVQDGQRENDGRSGLGDKGGVPGLEAQCSPCEPLLIASDQFIGLPRDLSLHQDPKVNVHPIRVWIHRGSRNPSCAVPRHGVRVGCRTPMGRTTARRVWCLAYRRSRGSRYSCRPPHQARAGEAKATCSPHHRFSRLCVSLETFMSVTVTSGSKGVPLKMDLTTLFATAAPK